jgi:hypothetical protein
MGFAFAAAQQLQALPLPPRALRFEWILTLNLPMDKSRGF